MQKWLGIRNINATPVMDFTTNEATTGASAKKFATRIERLIRIRVEG